VFAVLAAGAFFYGAYRWAAQQDMPVVGDGIDGPEWNSSQYQNMFAAFGSTNDSYPSYTGMPAFFKSQGGSSYCGVGYNAPSTVGNGEAMVGSMKAAHVPVPYTNFGIVPGNTNFTSVALSIKQAKCNILGSQMTLGDTLNLITALKNANGKFVTASVAGATAAAAQNTSVSPTNFSITNEPGDTTYPIAGFSWVMLRTSFADATKGKAVVYLFKWLVSSDGQKEGADLQYAPLPTAVQSLAQSNLKLIKAGGAAVLS